MTTKREGKMWIAQERFEKKFCVSNPDLPNFYNKELLFVMQER